MRQNHFNSASALSTLVFLLIFFVAFVMIRFLGADVSGNSDQRIMKRAQRRAQKQARKQQAQTRQAHAKQRKEATR